MNKVEKVKKLKSGFKFYKNSFELHPPYLILLDSNFIFAAVDSQINLEEAFTSVVKGQIYLKVSDCALKELDQMQGRNFSEAKKYAHTKCQKFVCKHPPKSPNQCILQALSQGFKGFVCTQDQQLRRKIHRDYPKTPVFFIINQTLTICPPPKSLREKVKNDLIAKYAPQAIPAQVQTEKDDDFEINDDDLLLEEEEEEEEFLEDNE